MELVDADRISAIFKGNVVYPSIVVAAALPHLEASEGLIVNMSSTYGSKAGAPLSYYAASKAAVEHLTRCWALEFAPKKIRVNAIASGPVETTFMQKQMGLPDDVIEAIKEHARRSEEHTSELQSLMRIPSAVFCLNKKKNTLTS